MTANAASRSVYDWLTTLDRVEEQLVAALSRTEAQEREIAAEERRRYRGFEPVAKKFLAMLDDRITKLVGGMQASAHAAAEATAELEDVEVSFRSYVADLALMGESLSTAPAVPLPTA